MVHSAPVPWLQGSYRAPPLFLTPCFLTSSVAGSSGTTQQPLIWKLADVADGHTRGWHHTHWGVALPAQFASLPTRTGIRTLSPSTGKTQKAFWVHSAEVNSVTAGKAQGSSEKGLYKNGACYSCNDHSYSLSPHPFFPSCACDFKRSKQPEEVLCISIWRWFLRSQRKSC